MQGYIQKCLVEPIRRLLPFIIALMTLLASVSSNATILAEALLDESAPGGPKLTFRLKNSSDQIVRFPRGLTPWSETVWNGFVLLGVDPGADHTLIPKANALRNPTGILEIGPNAESHGEILLTKVFPTIVQQLRQGNIILFWSYNPISPPGIEITPTGGWFLLKQRHD